MTNWNIGGDGGNSFPFDHIGDTVTGQIVSLQEVQQTDLQTGEPKTFANGQPMMMYRISLATQLRDPANPSDDGHCDIYLKGSRKSETQSSLAAVLDAVRAVTGGTDLEPNATLSLTYIGDGQQAQRGFNPPKLYKANYQRAAMGLGGAPVPQAQQYQQAPAPQYAPAQAVAPQYAQPAYQQAPAQQYTPPAPPVQQALAAPAGPTPEQVAAVRAAGVDPATVFPGWQG